MTDHGSIVTGLAAGVGSVTLSLFGVNPAALVLPLVACTLGASRAPPSGFWRGVAVFGAAVIATTAIADLLAPLAAMWFPWASPEKWRGGIALIVGVTLHSVIDAANAAVPVVFRTGADRLRGPKK